MAPTRSTTTTDQKGCGSCGDAFSDEIPAADLESASITRIIVTHAQNINSLTVFYSGITGLGGVRHGGADGKEDEIVLAPGEIITSIKGSTAPSCMFGSLTFQTNKRCHGPFGRGPSTREPLIWAPPGSVTPTMELLYFTGRASTTGLHGLQATFADVCNRNIQPSTILKLENIQEATPGGEEVGLSQFARNLISQQVTLCIGPKQITFHVSRDVLCRLPYFHAALTGGFREAADNQIVMPEERPDTIAALIEFLYNGVYTYTYTGTNPPPSDLAQGEFHVAVYAVADRYDCQPLAHGAVANFMRVLQHLGEQDCLMLWKAAYAHDLPLSKWGIQDGGNPVVPGLAKQLRVLYRDHKGEVQEVFKMYPTLATDILELVVAKTSIE